MSQFTTELLEYSTKLQAIKEAVRNISFAIGNAQRMGDRAYEEELRKRRNELEQERVEAQRDITHLIQSLRVC